MEQIEAVARSEALYSSHVNPQWARLLSLLDMNVRYTRCVGAELFTSGGRRILDFLSGYCVHNVGHNHPRVIAAIKDELDRLGPAMLQSHVSELAGELASRLCDRAGGRLNKAFFASSGSEGIEAAIKYARAHTRRSGLLCAEGAFHGLTCGALSLMGGSFWRERFDPLLPDVEQVVFNDLEGLERKLSTRRFAAFIVEPIQSEAGVRVPDPHYLQEAQALCRRHGTLLVADEVQTGMFRTGPFLGAHHFDIDPDMVVLAKALSGGLIPSAAVLMSDEVYESIHDTLHHALIHTSTFSENGLAMRAGLATLEVLEEEGLGARAAIAGENLRNRLSSELSGYEIFDQVRGVGLLSGIVLKSPKRLGLKFSFEAFQKIHPAMLGQILVMRLFREHGILTQICGNNFMVLKVAPPLIVEDEHLDAFVSAVKRVFIEMHSSTGFWSEALRLARRVVNI